MVHRWEQLHRAMLTSTVLLPCNLWSEVRKGLQHIYARRLLVQVIAAAGALVDVAPWVYPQPEAAFAPGFVSDAPTDDRRFSNR
jgi:hypothetical protein